MASKKAPWENSSLALAGTNTGLFMPGQLYMERDEEEEEEDEEEAEEGEEGEEGGEEERRSVSSRARSPSSCEHGCRASYTSSSTRQTRSKTASQRIGSRRYFRDEYITRSDTEDTRLSPHSLTSRKSERLREKKHLKLEKASKSTSKSKSKSRTYTMADGEGWMTEEGEEGEEGEEREGEGEGEEEDKEDAEYVEKEAELAEALWQQSHMEDEKRESEEEWPPAQNPRIFGPPTWRSYQGTAQLAAFRGELARRCIEALPAILMCPACAARFEEYLEREPLTSRDLSRSVNVAIWFSEAHNDVNRRLNKPEVDSKLFVERTADQPLTRHWTQDTFRFLYHLFDHYHPSLFRTYVRLLTDFCTVWATDAREGPALSRAIAKHLHLDARHPGKGCWANRYNLVTCLHQVEKSALKSAALPLTKRVHMLKDARLARPPPSEPAPPPLRAPAPPAPSLAVAHPETKRASSSRKHRTSYRREKGHGSHGRRGKAEPSTKKATEDPGKSSVATRVPLFRLKTRPCAQGCGI